MPNIRFGWKSSFSTAFLGEQTIVSSHHNELMDLLELCLTPGCHMVAYESQSCAQDRIGQIISIVSPFMQIGLHGFDVPDQTVTDLSSELIATDIDLAFIHYKMCDQINISDILSCNGTTIIVEIKNRN